MIRYTICLAVAIATAATALAAVQPAAPDAKLANVTVIEKNDPFPVLGPIVVEDCAKEDCSDVQS